MNRELQEKINAAIASRDEAHRSTMKRVFTRAAALGEEGQALAFRLFMAGKTHDEITDALLEYAARNRRAEASGKRLEQISDDEFVRSLSDPATIILEPGKGTSDRVFGSAARTLEAVTDNDFIAGLTSPATIRLD